MITCLNCDRLPEPGRVFCSDHSADFKRPERRGFRTFMFFMVIGLVLGAIVACSFAGAHVLQSSWASVFHYNP